MSAFLNFRRGKYQDAINDAQRYVTLFPASRRRGLRAVPDRRILFPPDPRRDARPGSRQEGDGCDGRGHRQISAIPNTPTTRTTRSTSRATRSPARRCRSAAIIAERHEYPGGGQPLPHGRGAIPDDAARRGGAAPADRDAIWRSASCRRRRRRPPCSGTISPTANGIRTATGS